MNFQIKTPSRYVFEVINALLLLAFGIICLLPCLARHHVFFL